MCSVHLLRFFLKRAPFSVEGGELKLEHVHAAYGTIDAFHHGSVSGYASVTAIVAESKALQVRTSFYCRTASMVPSAQQCCCAASYASYMPSACPEC